MSRPLVHKLPGGAISFPGIAGTAGRHDVVPAGVATPGQGMKVVQLQLAGSPAIDAGVIVESQNLLPFLGGERSANGALASTPPLGADLSGTFSTCHGHSLANGVIYG
jgi:hypothetical protein